MILSFKNLPVRAAAVCWSLVIWSLGPAPDWAEEGRFVDRVYRDAEGEHKYVVFEPAGYHPGRRWPLILYLHGASGRGTDGRGPLMLGMGPAVKQRAATLPFLVVFPQCENVHSRLLGGWHEEPRELERALRILHEVEQAYAVDRSHEVLVGTSMGGFGAWELAARMPERWRAVIPISGGGDPQRVTSLARTRIWAFHALDDQLVPPSASSGLVEQIQQAGGQAWVSLLPGGGHNISLNVLARDEVFEWMLHPDQPPRLKIDWDQPVSLPSMIELLPFRAGAQVPSAVQIHVGRDVMESLATVLPAIVPPEQLQGTQPDRIQTAQSGLLNFMITVQGITYSGKLERAWLEPQVPDRLRLQLGLRHLWMTIHQAHIEGWLLRAQAGPMGLVIGTNSPVWLTLDLQLVVEDQRLRLHPVGVDFRIPDDNWGIMPPQYVEAGLWSFLGERISERLTQGLAEQRVAIEQQIRDSSVALVKKIEEQVERIFQRTIAPGNWPMPLWQPRFRFYPEQVACSEKGISLTLGAWVAAMGLRDPQAPCYRYPVRKPQTTVETGPGLQLALSPTLLEAWCVLLHESQVARFHVFDLHAPQLRILGTRQFWQDCWPELQEPWVNEVCDVQFEISQPPQLVFKPSGTDDVAELWMRLPEFQLHLKANTVTGREISGLFACAFEQPINLQLQRTSYQTREVYVNLPRVSPPVLTFLSGEPIPSTQTLHKLSEQLTAGWYENFGRQPRRLKVSDLRWADIPVRFERLQTTHDQLIASWERPGLRLRNATDQVQQYRVRTTWSSWSPPYTLHPGEIHEFHPRHQLWWMGASATQTVYRLSLGEVFEWRSGGLVQLLPGEKSSRVLHVDASSSGRR